MSAITTAFERSGTRLAWIHGGRRALQRLFDAGASRLLRMR